MTPRPSPWIDEIAATRDATLDQVAEAVGPAGDAGSDLVEGVRLAADGGKGLRGELLVTSHHAHGGGHHDAAVALAAALELFQVAALIHDDVIDDSDTRRGRAATHRAFAAAAPPTLDAATYGRSAAILAGDLALLASHRAETAALRLLPPDIAATAAARYAEVLDLVTAGQFLDIRLAATPVESVTEAEVRALMEAKTASYTGVAPLVLGAAAAGAAAAQLAAMADAGRQLGVAFQLRDDVLGLVGDPRATGKPAGDDVREGKRTLILIRAWRATDPAGAAAITRALGVRDATPAVVDDAVAAIVATGAIDTVEREIDAAADAAREAILQAGLTEPYATALIDAVSRFTARER